MTLRELAGRADLPDVPVSGLSGDSRQVQPGDAFVACAGQAFDGHAFVPEAERRGAVAVLSERAVQATIPVAVLPDLARRRGQLAARFHSLPSERLIVVGVTGTNGKTTVAHSIAAAMPRAAFAGTVGWGFPKALQPAHLTTEDPITVQARLRTLLDAGANSVAMEVSSHALEQGRVQEVAFDVAVFTNLSRDHLDFHGSMACYADAKKKLFRRDLRAAIANIDDATGRSILAETSAAGVDSFGFGRAPDADVSWRNVRYDAQGLAGTWHTPWGKASFKAPGFFGEFSLQNLAATLTAQCALGIPLDDAAASMAQLTPPPGRMQVADEAAEPLTVIDYAHTPDALAAVLTALRQHLPAASTRRLLVVFGCGGDRDRGKRAPMAEAAETGADAVFLTSDNPRGEDPERILDDAMQGFRDPDRVCRMTDRTRAIEAAIGAARAIDIVLIAGKGHETYQEIDGVRRPFSDLDHARAALARTRTTGGSA